MLKPQFRSVRRPARTRPLKLAEELDELVSRIPVRVQVDVREPHAPDPRPDLRLRIDRHGVAAVARGVDPERSPVSGVQNVFGVVLVHVPGELGAIRVLDRVEDEVQLVEVLLALGIGEDHLRQP